jgi:hypothetical protein
MARWEGNMEKLPYAVDDALMREILEKKDEIKMALRNEIRERSPGVRIDDVELDVDSIKATLSYRWQSCEVRRPLDYATAWELAMPIGFSVPKPRYYGEFHGAVRAFVIGVDGWLDTCKRMKAEQKRTSVVEVEE